MQFLHAFIKIFWSLRQRQNVRLQSSSDPEKIQLAKFLLFLDKSRCERDCVRETKRERDKEMGVGHEDTNRFIIERFIHKC